MWLNLILKINKKIKQERNRETREYFVLNQNKQISNKNVSLLRYCLWKTVYVV